MRARDLFAALRPSQGGSAELVDKRGHRLRLIHLGEVAQQAGRLLDRPPLTVFWESDTGCLRVTHRELVLRFASSVPERRRRVVLAEGGCSVLRVNPFVRDQLVVSRHEKNPAGEELIALANRWMEMEEVLFATPGFLSEYRRQRPPAVRPEEWHLSGPDRSTGADIRVTDAWRWTMGEPGIVVAVLDDGVDLEHPNLAPNLWRNPDPMAPDPLGRQGRGAAVFCAAGNGRGAPVAFPACSPNTVAVGASTDLGTWAEYANRGSEISVVAPSSGGNRRIFTTDVSQPGRGFAPRDTHTDQFGGTSASAAITAGVGALVLSAHPGLDREELKDLLEQTADKIGGGYDAQGHSREFGFGRVNAGRAVEEAARRAGRMRQPVSSKRGYSGRACSTRPLSCCRPPRSS